MIDMREAFHVGVRVVDLDAAMSDLSVALDIKWASPRTNEAQPIWTPMAGAEEVPLRYCYSVEGPLHIELVESSGGSFWDGSDQPGNHHVGIWVDDVAAEADSLICQGWTLMACRAAPTGKDRYGLFAYLQPPTGILIEIVSRELLPKFEAWWAGG
jgi:catechol 2,3-dioxygenase-like lactoylglutathione lyase family enzyme